MRIFDFECPKCGVIEEILVPNSESTVDCDRCKVTMIKHASAVGLLKTNFHDKPSVKKR